MIHHTTSRNFQEPPFSGTLQGTLCAASGPWDRAAFFPRYPVTFTQMHGMEWRATACMGGVLQAVQGRVKRCRFSFVGATASKFSSLLVHLWLALP